MDAESKSDEVNILVVTDVHLPCKNTARLKAWVSETGFKIDYLLCPGDLLNLKEKDADDREKSKSAESEISDFFRELQEIHPTVYYVPGNHDPITLFSDTSRCITKNAINVHGKTIKLRDDLYLSGFGGSTPATVDGKLYWKGYPYRTSDSFSSEFNSFVDSIEEGNGLPDLIFMTHMGPTVSSTTRDFYHSPGNCVETGNADIYNALNSKKLQSRAIFNLHGHAHVCPGQGWVGEVRSINPGPFRDKENRFLIMKLAKKDGLWKIATCSFHELL